MNIFNFLWKRLIGLLQRFDLWEEVSSSSFFTTIVQHRALREGARLGDALGFSTIASGYSTQADNILCFLQVGTAFPSLPVTDLFC